MGACVDLDMAERMVEVEMPAEGEGKTTRAYVPCEYSPVPKFTSSNVFDKRR
jgi:hypothetical protein